MKNIFDTKVHEETIQRINKLSPDSIPDWGKMSVDQMLAHCSVAYEMAYTDKHPKPNGFMRFLLRTFVKNGVVSEKPYPKNSRTAPVFIISERKDFEVEKKRLISFVQKTFDYGPNYFDGKESLSFGPMTTQEWNNQFYKHLDHHLTQFGV
ncbi:DUF1569 domain-containing protein [Algoriphagus sp. AGSA1]|uniref:DUF1569 domain-containing protein n=1 Tax=Algoriphagus sp. AGSA1 TaxID=2907213 RepID=UPI001F426BA8|nr:DUF1569 domain-containing protein [Algoriphagus sp. AGSA1]MCE7055042.1 DUF1569 domain-containing protein [Algoriphagus sp. AGSA1]